MKVWNLVWLLGNMMVGSVMAYSIIGVPTRRSTLSMKRGRGSFKKEVEGTNPNSDDLSSSSSSMMSSSNEPKGMGMTGGKESSPTVTTNWILVPKVTARQLPAVDGKVQVLDTYALTLVDKATNPTGAVAVVKYGPDTFCCSIQCPSCKIPLTKAKVLPANDETSGKAPRLACDFCQATYNLKTGEKVTSQQGGGLFGAIAKTVLSANQDASPLPIYRLGEKDGRILFSMK